MKSALKALSVVAALSLFFGCESGDKPAQEKQQTKVTRIGTEPSDAPKKSEPKESTATGASAATSAKSPTETTEASTNDSNSTEPKVYVSGRVTTPDGSPVADARVELSGPGAFMGGLMPADEESTPKTTTNTDGRYDISTTSTGYMVARFSKDGMGRVMLSIYDDKIRYEPERKQDLKVVKNVVLTPGFEISGKVIDDAGAPVTSATVMAMPDIYSRPWAIDDQKKPIPDNAITTSAADGTFKITQLLDQEYMLSADNPDYVGATQNAKAPTENVTITLAREGGKVEGRVVMLSTGESVASATVNLSVIPEMRGSQRRIAMAFRPKKEVTGPDGAFVFQKLPAAKYTISASKDEMQTLVRNNNPTFSLAARETTSGVTIALYPGHTVTGVVTNFETKEPIEGVTIRNQNFYWGPRQSVSADVKKRNETQTDAQGRYRLEHQFGSQVSLSVEKKGFKFYFPDRNNWSTPQVTLQPDVFEVEKNIEMAPTISVYGAVKLENGRNAVGAKITPFVRNDHSQKPEILTDKNGEYEVEVMPFTSLKIKAALSQFPAAFSELVEVEDKSVTATDIIVKAGGTLAGTVAGPDDQAMPEAKVAAYVSVPLGGGYSNSDSFGDVTTDAAGNFLITNVPHGDVSVYATKKGFARSKTEQIAMTAQEAKTGVALKLGKGFTISGRVVDEKKEPVQGANLNCWVRSGGGGSGHATTDEKGAFKMEDLSEGVYEVSAYAGNYRQVSKQGVKTGTEDLEIVMKSTSSKPDEKDPQGSGVFVGKVIDWKTRQPVTDFKVNVTDNSGGHKLELDQPNGRFTITGLRLYNGFSLTIDSPGYMTVKANSLSIQSLAKPLEQEFVLGPGGSMSGRVVAKDNKRPLEGVRVYLLGLGEEYNMRDRQPEKTTQTGADGTFAFEQVAAGKNWIQLRPTVPIVSQRRSLDVQQGTAADFGDIELGTGGVIEGKLLRVPGDAPVPEVSIEGNCYEANVTKSTKTDAKGEFRLEGLTPGGYSISAKQHKVNTYQQVKDGETANVTLKIGSGVLKGTVLKRGTPLTDTQVSMSQEGQNASTSAQTDMEGKFTIEGLAPGKWKIQIMPRYTTDEGMTYYGGYRQGDTVEIPEGELSKTFEVPSGRILGSVMDGAGQPVPKVRLTLKTPPGMNIPSYGERVTKADGTFLVDDLEPGEYQVSARHNTLGYGSVKANVPQNGDVENAVIKLEKGNGGTLVSVVLNMEGQPIKEAWCNLTGPGGSFAHEAQRDASGMMTMTDIPPGKYKVEVSYWSHSSSEREVEIKSGETVRIDDVLYPAGALRWTLQDKDGGPLRNIKCTLTAVDPNSIEKVRTGNTDYNGLWVIRGMGAGEYMAVATLADGKTISEKVNIAAGQPTAVTTKAP